MSDPFVVDSSIEIAWVHPSQATDLTRECLELLNSGDSALVPSIWHLEVANALLVAVRRKLMTEPQRSAGLRFLSSLNLEVDEQTSLHAWTSTSELAVKHNLSIYDAAYLELARRSSLPLGSRDEALRLAARKCGVRLL